MHVPTRSEFRDDGQRSRIDRVRSRPTKSRALAVAAAVAAMLLTGLVAVTPPPTAQAASNLVMQPVVAANENNDLATKRFTTIVITGTNLPVAPINLIGHQTQKFAQVRNVKRDFLLGGVGANLGCSVLIGASSSTELILGVGNMGPLCFFPGDHYIVYSGDVIEVNLFDPVRGNTTVQGAPAVASPSAAVPELPAVTPPFGPMNGGNEVVITTPPGSVAPQAFWFGGYSLASGWYGTATTNIAPAGGNKFKVVPPAFISNGQVQNYGVSVFSADSSKGLSSQNCTVLLSGCSNEYHYLSSNLGSIPEVDLSVGIPGFEINPFTKSIDFPTGPASAACGLGTGIDNEAGASVSISAGLAGKAKMDYDIGVSYNNANLPQAVVGNGVLTVLEPITFDVELAAQISGCVEIPLPGLSIPSASGFSGGLYIVVGGKIEGNITLQVKVAKGTYSFTGGWTPNASGFGTPDVACVDDDGDPTEVCVTTEVTAGVKGTLIISPLWLQLGVDIPSIITAEIGVGLSAAGVIEAEFTGWPPVGQVEYDVCAALRWAATVNIADVVTASYGDNLIGPFNIIGKASLCPFGAAAQPPQPPLSTTKSTVVASPTQVLADGTTASTVTVTLLAKDDTPKVSQFVNLTANAGTSSAIAPSFGATGAGRTSTDVNGVATFTVTNVAEETVTYNASVGVEGFGAVPVPLTQTADVTFANPPPVSASKSTVVASPTEVAADGTTESTVTVTLIASDDAPRVGTTVALAANAGTSSTVSPPSGPSDASGVVTFTVTNTTEEAVTYTATADGVTITQTAEVTFANPPPLSAAKSTVVASPIEVAADGTAASTVTVTLLATDDSPIVGNTVALTVNTGTSSVISAPSGPSDASGVVTFTVTDTTEETVTYTAASDGVVIAQTADVSFAKEDTAPPAPVSDAAKSTIVAAPAAAAADGVAQSTLTVTLLAADDSPVPGKSVTLTGNAGTSSAISAPSGPSSAAGVVTFTVTDEVEEAVTYTATDTTDSVVVAQTAQVTFTNDDPDGDFTSLAPARVLDTRDGQSTIDDLFNAIGKRQAGSIVELQIGGRGGVAPDASSAVLNLTVVAPDDRGYLTLFPCGSDQPTASNVNYEGGQTIANVVIAKIGDDGKVCIYTSASAHILADVKDGFFPASSPYAAIVPGRLLDSRPGSTTVDGQSEAIGRRSAESVTELQVTGRAGVAADATAVVLNIAAVGPDGRGYLTVFPCGSDQPTASNVNYESGQTIANVVVAKIGVDGKVCIYTKSATHLLADVSGSFAASSTYAAVDPARILDSRAGGTTVDGESAAIGRRPAGSVTELQVTGRGGVAVGSTVVVMNITAVGPVDAGFLIVFPCGTDQPTASNVNFVAGETIANVAVAKIGDGGKVCLFTSSATHLVADVNGAFPGMAA